MESIAEDMYLCCVARLYGYPVQVTKSSGYRHWQGMSFSGKRTDTKRLVSTYHRRVLSERNKTITMIVTIPACLLPVVFPAHMIILFIEGATLAMFTCNKSLFVDVYLQLPYLIYKNFKLLSIYRSKVQTARVVGGGVFLSPFKWFPWKLRMLFQFGLPLVR
jgi:hypothetical protein